MSYITKQIGIIVRRIMLFFMFLCLICAMWIPLSFTEDDTMQQIESGLKLAIYFVGLGLVFGIIYLAIKRFGGNKE